MLAGKVGERRDGSEMAESSWLLAGDFSSRSGESRGGKEAMKLSPLDLGDETAASAFEPGASSGGLVGFDFSCELTLRFSSVKVSSASGVFAVSVAG